jgi:hypothetical protein
LFLKEEQRIWTTVEEVDRSQLASAISIRLRRTRDFQSLLSLLSHVSRVAFCFRIYGVLGFAQMAQRPAGGSGQRQVLVTAADFGSPQSAQLAQTDF